MLLGDLDALVQELYRLKKGSNSQKNVVRIGGGYNKMDKMIKYFLVPLHSLSNIQITKYLIHNSRFNLLIYKTDQLTDFYMMGNIGS